MYFLSPGVGCFLWEFFQFCLQRVFFLFFPPTHENKHLTSWRLYNWLKWDVRSRQIECVRKHLPFRESDFPSLSRNPHLQSVFLWCLSFSLWPVTQLSCISTGSLYDINVCCQIDGGIVCHERREEMCVLSMKSLRMWFTMTQMTESSHVILHFGFSPSPPWTKAFHELETIWTKV